MSIPVDGLDPACTVTRQGHVTALMLNANARDAKLSVFMRFLLQHKPYNTGLPRLIDRGSKFREPRHALTTSCRPRG